jgi:hypothetical protein
MWKRDRYLSDVIGKSVMVYVGCAVGERWILLVAMLEGDKCILGFNKGRRWNFSGCDVGER